MFQRFAHTIFITAVVVMNVGAEGTASPRVAIQRIEAHGSGCPDGSVKTGTVLDGQGFRVDFGQFHADLGPDVPFSARQRRCDIIVEIAVPAGYQYSPGTFELTQAYALGSQVDLIAMEKLRIQGHDGVPHETRTSGPAKDSGTTTVNVPQVWSSCGQQENLVLTIEQRLTGSGVGAADTLALVSGTPFIVRKCP